MNGLLITLLPLLICAAMAPSAIAATLDDEFLVFKNSLSLKASRSPLRQDRRLSPFLHKNDGHMMGAFPLYSSARIDSQSTGVHVIRLHGAFDSIALDSTAVKPSTLLGGKLGVNYLYSNQDREISVLSVSTLFLNESRPSPPIHLRLSALALGSYRLDPKFLGLYGLAYFSLFGKNLFLPLLGFHWTLADRWTLTSVLPVSIALSHQISSDLTIKGFLSAQGTLARVNAKDFGVSSHDATDLVIKATTFGFTANLKASRDVGLSVTTGVEMARQTKLFDQNELLSEKRFGPSLFVQGGISYLFGGTPLDDFLGINPEGTEK